MSRWPEKNACISGIGISRIGRRLGTSGLDLTLEAVRTAIDDAGLTAADIDGIASMGDTPVHEVATAMDIKPGYTGGGFDSAGLLAPLFSAAVAVGESRARHVLVYRTVQMMGGTITPGEASEPERPTTGSPALAEEAHRNESGRNRTHDLTREVMGDMETLLVHHAFSAAHWLALHCQRHMHLYGTTKEHLGWLAINSRHNAALNPRAVMRDEMTMADYMAARPITTPFGLLDCDIPIDGSIALIVSAGDYADDAPHRAVRFDAIGGSAGQVGWIERPDYPRMASTDAATQMWSRSDLRPEDVDVAELYDGFTFLTLSWLEALGLCAEGESGPFVEGATRIALDGALPLNTYGGQLSAGRMHGYWVVHEAVTQLRLDAGDRQIAHPPEVAVVSAGGGPIAGCALLTV